MQTFGSTETRTAWCLVPSEARGAHRPTGYRLLASCPWVAPYSLRGACWPRGSGAGPVGPLVV